MLKINKQEESVFVSFFAGNQGSATWIETLIHGPKYLK